MRIKLNEADATLASKIDEAEFKARQEIVTSKDLIADALDDAYREAKAEKSLRKGSKSIVAKKRYFDDEDYISDDSIKELGIWNAEFENEEDEEDEEEVILTSNITWPNVLLVGGAGVGKTARVKAWAKKRNVTIVLKLASSLERVDMGGVQTPIKVTDQDGNDKYVAARLSPIEFDALDDPNSILFLDEFNRANQSVRGAMLTLINDHLCVDASSQSGVKELDFLFTVAAINPGGGMSDYNTDELDAAERSRFRTIKVTPETEVIFKYYRETWNTKLRYYIKELKKIRSKEAYNKIVECKNKLDLLDALEGVNFKFNDDADDTEMENFRNNADWNNLITTPRSFEALLNICDGTKESLFKYWNDYCNNLERDDYMNALKSFESKYEKKDKANDALGSFAKKTAPQMSNQSSRLKAVRDRFVKN